MRRRLRNLTLSPLVSLTLCLTAGLAVPVALGAAPAAAATDSCQPNQSSGGTVTGGGGANGTISIDGYVFLTGSACSPGTSDPGSGVSGPAPACWWQPLYTPAALKAWAYANYANASSAEYTWQQIIAYYETDGNKGETTPPGYTSTSGPPYSNWNIGASPGGMWWGIVFNDAMVGTQAFSDCLNETLNKDGEPWSWVPNGTPGPANVAAPVISDYLIAQYAASMVKLPVAQVDSAPTTTQTVNLPAWIWGTAPADASGFGLHKVTAQFSLDPAYNATVDATVDSSKTTLTVSPSNEADVVSGGCVPNGATIGTPYQSSFGSQAPTCGVTFLQSTSNGSAYDVSLDTFWNVTWAATGQVLRPDLEVDGVAQAFQAQEIQSVVGPSSRP